MKKNDSDLLLSIIIPFHTVEITIVLDSLSNYKYKNDFEVILVSDGSNVDLDGIYYKYIKDINIKIVKSTQWGKIGLLRTLGIKQSCSDYLYFIDSDCWLEDTALTKIISTIYNNNIYVLKGKNIFIGRNWISKLDSQIREERYESNPTFAYCPNLIVHKDVFNEIGLFNSDYTYGSDGEFAKRLSDKGISVKYNEEIVLYHDCTSSFLGVFKKWTNYGEGRYYRYKDEKVKNILSTYFPNLFRYQRGITYNIAVLLCNIGRAIGIFVGWSKTRFISPQN
jgi:cellulose synthase/poly-beta-1,6-N-acetylglucosamine synthase-like glycosyltransferase